MNRENLKIIPLGGLGEIGRNMTIFEYDRKILIVDIGLMFPGEDLPGIDYVIPNIDYLKGRERDIVGVVITHGHLDHIGAIPHIMGKIGNPPIFAGELAKRIILKRQEDFPLHYKLNIKGVDDNEKINLNPFTIVPFRINHTIPDNFGYIIKTPVGNIVHTSDFKFDKNPVNEKPTDMNRLRRIGDKGVLLLMSDSTGAENPGHSLSEQTIYKNLDEMFVKNKDNRIIAATFSSLLNRIYQLIKLSEKYNRKVLIEGYSMKNNVKIAKELGYINVKNNIFVSRKSVAHIPDNQLTVICTGAQGEDNAALTRIINKEHPVIQLQRNDTIILSSSVVPGNERTVQATKDNMMRQGAKVYHYKMMDIHAGGHAQQEELTEMIKLMRPKFFVPIHGQYSMMHMHAKLAIRAGVSKENINIIENGYILHLNKEATRKEKEAVDTGYVLVDGFGVGDVCDVVLGDRIALADDGIFVIIAVVSMKEKRVMKSPDIISRGFIHLKESRELLQQVRKFITFTVDKSMKKTRKTSDLIGVKKELKREVTDLLYKKIKRKPMVIPVIIDL